MDVMETILDNEIAGCYVRLRGNQYSAAATYRVGLKRVIRVWNQYGLKPRAKKRTFYPGTNGGRHKISKEVLEEIGSIRCYARYNGNSKLASLSIPYSPNKIGRIWRRKGYTADSLASSRSLDELL